jgi:hypothetical protein
MRPLFGATLILLACGCALADYTKPDLLPISPPDVLSTNWLAEVKQAIPSAHVTPESNFQTITNLLCQESRRGNVAAQGLWGFFLLVQSRSPEDAAAGLALLRNSATNGFVPAMLNLGLLSQGGVYVRQDYSEAFHWFSETADKNNPEGLLQLGKCHHYGLGTTRNLAKAAECYRRAAELTNYVAMKSLGYLLMNGLGVQKDTDAAKRWFMRAAKEGNNRRAMYNLGVLCFTNVSEAFQWFKQSAELGTGLRVFSWQISITAAGALCKPIWMRFVFGRVGPPCWARPQRNTRWATPIALVTAFQEMSKILSRGTEKRRRKVIQRRFTIWLCIIWRTRPIACRGCRLRVSCCKRRKPGISKRSFSVP